MLFHLAGEYSLEYKRRGHNAGVHCRDVLYSDICWRSGIEFRCGQQQFNGLLHLKSITHLLEVWKEEEEEEDMETEKEKKKKMTKTKEKEEKEEKEKERKKMKTMTTMTENEKEKG